MFNKNQSCLCRFVTGIFFILAAVVLVQPVVIRAAQAKGVDPFVQNKKLGRGVNIIGYDPIWRSKEKGRFKEKYFRMIKDAGFSNVRINLYAFRYMDADNNYNLSDSWWQVLNWAVDNALKSKLMVILDMHEFGAMGTNPEANKGKFLAFWRQVSERFKDAPDSVLFEILNEPSRKLDAQMWNQYLMEALAIIRKTNLTRTVIIGPANYNQIAYLDQLTLPEDDRNIIVTIHYYTPMDFTHQGAAFANRRDKTGIEWNGTAEEKQDIERSFERAQAWSKKHNRPIFLGEFGVYDRAPMESRVRYLSFITRTMERLGWSWAYWQFDSDFILYDIPGEHWIEQVRDALVPPGE
jgi:endoglucanase